MTDFAPRVSIHQPWAASTLLPRPPLGEPLDVGIADDLEGRGAEQNPLGRPLRVDDGEDRLGGGFGVAVGIGDTVFLEASLANADGELAAISTATAQVIQLADARHAA